MTDDDDLPPLWPVVLVLAVLLLGVGWTCRGMTMRCAAVEPEIISDGDRSFTLEDNSSEPTAVGAVTITESITLMLAAVNGDTGQPLPLDQQLRLLPHALEPNVVVERYTFMRVKADDGEWVAERITFRNERTGLTRTVPAPQGLVCAEEVGQ